jgi:hypothetical protein
VLGVEGSTFLTTATMTLKDGEPVSGRRAANRDRREHWAYVRRHVERARLALGLGPIRPEARYCLRRCQYQARTARVA